MSDPVSATLRGGEWWDYKLVPILTGFYASALFLGQPVAAPWGNALILLLSLLPGAAYVSIVNDLTDLRDDAAAGKANRMAGRSLSFKAILLFLSLAAGVPFFWFWRDNMTALILYAGAWAAFALYSLPPFRLKSRGVSGVVADACGAHLFPTLLAAALAFQGVAEPLRPAWFWAIAAWSLGYGLRGNLWHQLLDRDADRAVGLGTFAARHRPHVAARLGAWFAFPLETAGLTFLLFSIASPLPVMGFLIYLGLITCRMRLWGLHPIIADPKPGFFIFLHEYYDVFLPLALLLASALAYPIDWLTLAVHLLLFHRRPMVTAQDAWTLVGKSAIPRLVRIWRAWRSPGR